MSNIIIENPGPHFLYSGKDDDLLDFANASIDLSFESRNPLFKEHKGEIIILYKPTIFMLVDSLTGVEIKA